MQYHTAEVRQSWDLNQGFLGTENILIHCITPLPWAL